MSKKHYTEIAARIRVARASALENEEPEYIAGWVEGADAVARELADAFAADNRLFDRAKFLEAAGVPS